METTYTQERNTEIKSQQTTATLIHLSTFTKYLFPFANYFIPLLIWSFNKDKNFVDEHGRQAINFQLSVLIYTLTIGLICLPFVLIFASDFISLVQAIDENSGFFSWNAINNVSGYFLLFGVAVLLLLSLFIFELYAVINAAIHATRGELYQYPLCIPFIKSKSLNHK